VEIFHQNVKHRGYKNYLTMKSFPIRLFVMKKGFEDKNEDWGDTPPQSVNNYGHGRYSSWQRLTKRESPMSQPSLEGNKFDRITKRSFFKWLNLPKRQNANNAWRRLAKRLVMSQPQVGEEELQNIQRKSVHNNWLKLGYVTG
jgi:hypothetical protein